MAGRIQYLADQPTTATRYVASVHFTMAGALAVSAITALFVFNSAPLYASLFTQTGLTALGWIVSLSPLVIVFGFAGMAERLSPGGALLLLLVFAMLMGASLASLFSVYAAASIVTTFAVTAGAYGVLALVGYSTRRDLSGLSKFLLVGLVGLILAMLVNLFVRSNGADLVLAAIGVFIFAGLVAVDSQKIRRIYDMDETGASPGNLAVIGALTLYLDFLNLFVSLIRLTGRRR